MCRVSNYFTIGITISIWTIVQTSIHIVWVLCGFYLQVCKIKPSYYLLVVLYLTYFYSNDCGDITIDSGSLFATQKINKNIIQLDSNDTDNEDVVDILQAILEKAVLPQKSNAAWRTHFYFLAFLITDAVWIVSSFLLFAGTCFQIRKCLSLLFYCPWLFITAFLIFLDVVSAVHFGLDILQINSFTTWLKFIGVQNYDDFSDFNSHKLSHLIPTIPTITLCLLFCRIFFIWILNVANFFKILNIAVMAFQDNLDQRNPRNQRQTGRRPKSRNPGDQDLNLDSSASRIRSWQLFYGATETTSTGSSSSSKSGDKDCDPKSSPGSPRNSSMNAPPRDTDSALDSRQHSLESEGSYEKYVFSVRNEAAVRRTSGNTYYRRYSDVAENIDTGNGSNTGAASPLNNQLPWSYFPVNLERRMRTNRPSSVPVDDYGRFSTVHNPLGRAQTVCTKL